MEANSPLHPPAARNSSYYLSLWVCVIVTLLMTVMRVVVYPDSIFPLASGLPLLLCLWNRNLLLLYGMSAVFTAVTFYKVFELMPDSVQARSVIVVT